VIAGDLDAAVWPQVVLLAAQGLDNREIAARLRCPREVIATWRTRFYEQSVAGLDKPQSWLPAARTGS
jgi:transposase